MVLKDKYALLPISANSFGILLISVTLVYILRTKPCHLLPSHFMKFSSNSPSKMFTALAEAPGPRFPRPTWPELFNKRRNFDRAAENQPYIERLRNAWLDGEVDNDEEDGEGEEGEESEESASEHEDIDDYSELLNRVERGVDSDELGSNVSVGNWNHDDRKFRGQQSNVRLFMEGMAGDEETLKYRDQVEAVARFCEKSKLHEHSMALIDDSKHASDFEKNGPMKRHCRPYLGPLTSQKSLLQELRKKVGANPC